jgi:hypothetical protein
LVSVGTLRADIAAISPLVQDCVVAGLDKVHRRSRLAEHGRRARNLLDPNLKTPDEILRSKAVEEFVRERLRLLSKCRRFVRQVNASC